MPLSYYAIFHQPIKTIVIAVSNLCLLQSWIPRQEAWLSLNSVTWYLSTLIFLSCLSGKLLEMTKRVNERSGKRGILSLGGGIFVAQFIAATAFLHQSQEATSWFLYCFPVMRLLDYWIGILLFYCQHTKQIRVEQKNHDNLRCWFTVFVLLASLLVYPYVPYAYQRVVMFTPVSVFVLSSVIRGGGWLHSFLIMPILVMLGNASFEFYMVHQVVLRYFEKMRKYSGVPTSVCVLFAFAATITVGMAIKKISMHNRQNRKTSGKSVT